MTRYGAEPGEHLPGGQVGGAVRVGDTVRRPTGPWTPAVHALLGHLAERGLDCLPRVHGIDAAGREVLDFLPGEVPDLEHTTIGQLRAGAAWIGRFHRAVRDFRPVGALWRFGQGELTPEQIVCHNDATLYNMAFEGDRLTGVLDWDVAGPGRPVDDVAQLAWSGLPLYDPRPAAAVVVRLEALVGGYAEGLGDDVVGAPPLRAVSAREVLGHIATRVRAGCDRIEAGQRAGDEGMLNLARVGEPGRTRSQVDAFGSRLPELLARLD